MSFDASPNSDDICCQNCILCICNFPAASLRHIADAVGGQGEENNSGDDAETSAFLSLSADPNPHDF